MGFFPLILWVIMIFRSSLFTLYTLLEWSYTWNVHSSLVAVMFQEEINGKLRKLILYFKSLYSIITNICYAGRTSTFGLARYCSISCFTYSSCRFSIRFNGNHETTSGKHISSPLFLFLFFGVNKLNDFFWQTDPSQKNQLLILKFLPLMIGYFSLSVPSGLTIYWLVFQKLY